MNTFSLSSVTEKAIRFGALEAIHNGDGMWNLPQRSKVSEMQLTRFHLVAKQELFVDHSTAFCSILSAHPI